MQGHEVRLGLTGMAEGVWRFDGRTCGRQRSTVEGSVVCLAIDGTLRGEFVLANAVRPETGELLRGWLGGMSWPC